MLSRSDTQELEVAVVTWFCRCIARDVGTDMGDAQVGGGPRGCERLLLGLEQV